MLINVISQLYTNVLLVVYFEVVLKSLENYVLLRVDHMCFITTRRDA